MRFVPPRPPSASSTRLRMPRILVVDDDVQYGAKLVHALDSAGFPAHFRRSPFGTLSSIREVGADVVLLDVNMPKLDGATLARMIRDTYGSARVKVFLCSEMHPNMLARIAQRTGAAGSLSKEDGPAGVLRLLDTVLTNTGT